MIQITDKVKCTGCGACKNICPVDAIEMKLDEEGFFYPKVSIEKCIQCGQCDKICHMKVEDREKAERESVYAAWHVNRDVRNQVSSGGAFNALTEEMISRGGSVYGVVMDETLKVYHKRAVDLAECRDFMRSKYLESDTGNTYSQVKRDIEDGREVLFSGTGCQIAGLKAFLKNCNMEKLITCEVVCHGVPSRKAFESYISELEEQYHSRVRAINFRDKSKGWNQNRIRIMFENGEEIVESSAANLFHGNYIRGMFYRPSCGSCKYASLPRVADITLADFWKYKGVLEQKNENSGISLVICNNRKAEKFFTAASKQRMNLEKSDLESAVSSCRHLIHSPSESEKRGKFFRILKRKGYHKAINACMKMTIRKRLSYKIKGLKRRILKG